MTWRMMRSVSPAAKHTRTASAIEMPPPQAAACCAAEGTMPIMRALTITVRMVMKA